MNHDEIEKLNIEKSNVIDAVGVDIDQTTLCLMIIDGMDWQDESKHLVLLQEKFNTYLSYIETKSYEERYEGIQSIIIHVQFYFKETENCRILMDYVARLLKDSFANVSLKVDYGNHLS